MTTQTTPHPRDARIRVHVLWAALVSFLLVFGGALPVAAAPAVTAPVEPAPAASAEQARLIGVPSADGVTWHFVPMFGTSGAPVAAIGFAAGHALPVEWSIPAAFEDERVHVEWDVVSQPVGGDLTVSDSDENLVFGTGSGAPVEATWSANDPRSTVWSAEVPGTYELIWTTTLTRGDTIIEGNPVSLEVRVLESHVPRDRPDGQSDDPAPASATKSIVENIHTDMVSGYLDNGRLVLQSKADFPMPDGSIDLGRRIDPATYLFYVSDAAKTSVPAISGYEFLGSPGATIWMAPQIQDHAIIWPGFSTEDPNLRGHVENFQVRLTGVNGPGNVEVFMTGSGIERVFSSRTELSPWTIGVPQHTHMNWVFSEPGTYKLTFEMRGQVDGVTQRASNTYTMVVGSLSAHTKSTNVNLAADRESIAVGEGTLLTATLSPSDVTGTVQIRNRTTGAIIGHSPVRNGVAQFLADSLAGGQQELVAEFVPSYTNDFRASTSNAVSIAVRGEVFDRPEEDDTVPITEADLSGIDQGRGVLIDDQKGVSPGAEVRFALDADLAPGEWVSVWIVGAEWLGWHATDGQLSSTFRVPESLNPGTYRVAVRSTDGTILGWDRLVVASLVDPDAPGGGGGGGGGGGTDPTDTSPPTTAPTDAEQVCRPQLTLDHGHIDAFYVSASGGRAVLQLMEDVTGYHVIREAESVLLRVKPSAYRSGIPAGTPGAPSGYVLPLTQDPNLIWPGWDTNRTASSGYSDVSIRITSVNGPGTVRIFTRSPFGAIQSLLTSGGYALPGTIRESSPAHTHAEWVFPQEGIYILTAHAVATNPSTGASLTTASHRYVFQVGDVPIGDVFCSVKPSAGAAALARQVNSEVNQLAVEKAEEELEQAAALQSLMDVGPEFVGPDDVDPTDDATAAAADSGASGSRISPAALGLIVGGGVAAILGILGGMIWYVRKLGG